jgi:phage portal protein BeeE
MALGARIDEQAARKADELVTGGALPLGHELKPIGFEPEKGQLTEARRFVVEEVARIYGLPPLFLQDLTRATFANAETQDLHLVHTVGHWGHSN